MSLFKIDEAIVLNMLEEAIKEKVDLLAQEKIIWTIKDVVYYSSLSKSKLYDTILIDPRCPKFKVGTALRFPAKEMRAFLELWAIEQLEKHKYPYINE